MSAEGKTVARTAVLEHDRHARVDDQLCFALYATSRAVMGVYRAKLKDLGLTYPQYLTMLAVWEADGRTVRELGDALDLDSGTLSPILKRLQAAGYLEKDRQHDDERTVRISCTARGKELEAAAGAVRDYVEASTGLSSAEFTSLRASLHRLRSNIQD